MLNLKNESKFVFFSFSTSVIAPRYPYVRSCVSTQKKFYHDPVGNVLLNSLESRYRDFDDEKSEKIYDLNSLIILSEYFQKEISRSSNETNQERYSCLAHEIERKCLFFCRFQKNMRFSLYYDSFLRHRNFKMKLFFLFTAKEILDYSVVNTSSDPINFENSEIKNFLYDHRLYAFGLPPFKDLLNPIKPIKFD